MYKRQVGSWDSLAIMHRLFPLPSLAKELEPFLWTMCSVLGVRPDWWTVPTMELVHITVPTLKMLVSDAVLHFSVTMVN